MQINNFRRIIVAVCRCLCISVVLLFVLSPVALHMSKQYNINKTMTVEVCDTIGIIEPQGTEELNLDNTNHLKGDLI